MSKKAFTLIELLVVLAIIGILASLILSSLFSARIRARDAKRKVDMNQIFKAIFTYADQSGISIDLSQYLGYDKAIDLYSLASTPSLNLTQENLDKLPRDPKVGDIQRTGYLLFTDGTDTNACAFANLENTKEKSTLQYTQLTPGGGNGIVIDTTGEKGVNGTNVFFQISN